MLWFIAAGQLFVSSSEPEDWIASCQDGQARACSAAMSSDQPTRSVARNRRYISNPRALILFRAKPGDESSVPGVQSIAAPSVRRIHPVEHHVHDDPRHRHIEP